MFSIKGLRLSFPMLELWVARSVAGSASCCLASQLPPCPLSSTIRHLTGSSNCCLGVSPLCPLPISIPPTGLDKCFFVISLVVGLPYSMIFCQLWLFFVFKFLLSFFRLCEEAQCVYLHLHLGWKSCVKTRPFFIVLNVQVFHILA